MKESTQQFFKTLLHELRLKTEWNSMQKGLGKVFALLTPGSEINENQFSSLVRSIVNNPAFPTLAEDEKDFFLNAVFCLHEYMDGNTLRNYVQATGDATLVHKLVANALQLDPDFENKVPEDDYRAAVISQAYAALSGYDPDLLPAFAEAMLSGFDLPYGPGSKGGLRGILEGAVEKGKMAKMAPGTLLKATENGAGTAVPVRREGQKVAGWNGRQNNALAMGLKEVLSEREAVAC